MVYLYKYFACAKYYIIFKFFQCLPRVKDYVFFDCFVSILLTLKSTLLLIGFWYEAHAKGYFFWTFV